VIIKGTPIGSIKKWIPEFPGGQVKACHIIRQSENETELILQILPTQQGYISGKINIHFEKYLTPVSIQLVGWVKK